MSDASQSVPMLATGLNGQQMVRRPKRIQRQRTKGWRMPESAVYVGRPSRWGNMWRAGEEFAEGGVITAEGAVEQYRLLWTEGFSAAYVAYELVPLRGKDLVCWCPLDQPCHADVLLELANPEDAR